ncbi:hypothetical protein [Rossellomorea sp. NRS-1567]|uniref:hypothetical protein n=1 Tax=Rossellomorea sp. NRS-1567 TaxID=3233901 RepID=UPI003D271763
MSIGWIMVKNCWIFSHFGRILFNNGWIFRESGRILIENGWIAVKNDRPTYEILPDPEKTCSHSIKNGRILTKTAAFPPLSAGLPAYPKLESYVSCNFSCRIQSKLCISQKKPSFSVIVLKH